MANPKQSTDRDWDDTQRKTTRREAEWKDTRRVTVRRSPAGPAFGRLKGFFRRRA
jgi:hypothetical protein